MTNIREILPIQSVSENTTDMYLYLCSKLEELGVPYTTDQGNIYATKNPENLPKIPCFASHIDTVHDITEEIHLLEFYDGRVITGFNRVLMQQTGVGGDDKVGIYYCIRALEELEAVKVAFFTDEEIGCVGSGKAIMEFFSDVSMVLQGDRQGNTDFITKISNVELSSKEFQDDIFDIVHSHNYVYNDRGGITDVGQLRQNGLEIPVVNISCGYYNPHSCDEYINMDHVENGLKMFLEIATEFGDREYHVPKYVYTPIVYKNAPGYWDAVNRKYVYRTLVEEVEYYAVLLCDDTCFGISIPAHEDLQYQLVTQGFLTIEELDMIDDYYLISQDEYLEL